MNDIQIKQGDREPKLEATLTLGNPPVPVDLTNCTVKLRYALPYLGLTFEKDVAIVGTPDAGQVEYKWASGDTDIPGRYDAEWRVLHTVTPALPALPFTEQLSVPNSGFFLLEILPGVGHTQFNAELASGQTVRLLRRLRARLADVERLIYPDDSAFVQALMDSFEDAMDGIDLTITLFAPTDTGYAAGDPLNTNLTLERWQQDVWMLWTAREILETEVLAAARVAGTIETPAGRISMRDLAATLRATLDDVESDLDTKLQRKGAFFNFVNLSLSDAVRFLQD